MKNKLFSLALASLALWTLQYPLSNAHAQGTAFTYQGLLKNGIKPANGTYDLTFALYDDGTVGNLIAGPVTNAATVVSNGLFTTTIDFGPGIFTGTNYWLEIGVETNGAGGSFSVLSARQPLTPTPYAIYSATAGSAVTATTADTANAVSAGSVTGAGIAAGQVVTSLNGLADAVTLSAGTNVTITPNGNTLTIASAGAGGNGIWSVNANNAYYTAGKVGIGTSTPKGALQVAGGGVAVTGASSPYTGAGKGAFLEYSGTYGGILFAYDYGVNSPLNLLLNSPGGNVGIGTLTPSAKLTVHDTGSVSHRIETSGGVNAWARTEFANANGQWEVGTSLGYNSDSLYLHREGAATDALALQPNGNATFGGNVTLSGSAAVSHRLQTSGGVNSWTRLEFANANGQWNVGTSLGYNGDQFYFNRQGVSANALALQPNGDATFGGNVTVGGGATINGTAYVGGNASVCSLTIRGGCDLAEPFTTTGSQIEKGSVVVIDPEHPGQIKLSTTAYDTRVAGIVSGANGINPGIALQQEGLMEGGQNVALTGRVYVMADATQGAIKPGDLLTTSDMPGRAMKVTDHLRAQGAILGKAMTGLSAGTGMVLVLVTLQ
jgi:cytoskeletal protein CcmA (bactofilin family)